MRKSVWGHGGSDGKGEGGGLEINFGKESVGLADGGAGGKEEVRWGGWREKLGWGRNQMPTL